MKTFEFDKTEVVRIAKLVNGKTISAVEINDTHCDDFLVFKFTDGAVLEFRYDWIYDWGFKGPGA